MKIVTDDILKGYDGKDILNVDKKPLTVRDAIAIAINNYNQGEVPTAEQKNKAFQISIKLFANKEVDLTLDDRTFIKERAGVISGVIVYGRLCELLEGEDKKEDPPVNPNSN